MSIAAISSNLFLKALIQPQNQFLDKCTLTAISDLFFHNMGTRFICLNYEYRFSSLFVFYNYILAMKIELSLHNAFLQKSQKGFFGKYMVHKLFLSCCFGSSVCNMIVSVV